MQCPFVLLAKVDLVRIRRLESGEGNEMKNGANRKVEVGEI
jgi:hypothetical protein